jgi:hypothetical protein
MNDQITDILWHIHDLEERLEKEFEKKRAEYNVQFKGRLSEFQQEIKKRHRALRVGLLTFLGTANVLTVLVSPVIYSMIVPIAVVDLWVTLYQHICFRVYGIPRVSRDDYISLDREHLAYLNAIEKLNCVYCGYGNGVFAYAREIAGRTEQYWCPIKHARRIRDPHQRYLKFLEYGDAESYRAKLKCFRDDVRNS